MTLFNLYDKNGSISRVTCPTAATVGVFDGVHSGHRDLLRQLQHAARQTAEVLSSPVATLVVSLSSHPSFVLGRHAAECWLDDPDEHLRLLFGSGIDYVCLLPFSPSVAQTSACTLVRRLHSDIHLASLLTGYDSRFGSKQHDDFDQLPALASSLGISLHQGAPFLLDGLPVSSSRIRQALAQGDADLASHLLGRPYSLAGTVVHGRAVGRSLGFPTANVDISASRKMLPLHGVYVVRLSTPSTQPLLGMANLGPAPSFGIEKPLLEVHLLDFDGDLYGQVATVQFLHRLRHTSRFPSPDALRQQLLADIKETRKWS